MAKSIHNNVINDKYIFIQVLGHQVITACRNQTPDVQIFGEKVGYGKTWKMILSRMQVTRVNSPQSFTWMPLWTTTLLKDDFVPRLPTFLMCKSCIHGQKVLWISLKYRKKYTNAATGAEWWKREMRSNLKYWNFQLKIYWTLQT